MTYYIQCILERKMEIEEEWYLSTSLSWIPEKYAVQNEYIKLKNDSEWARGWKVVTVGRKRISCKEVRDRNRNWVETRETSDM